MSAKTRLLPYFLIFIFITVWVQAPAQYITENYYDGYGYVVTEPYKKAVLPADFRRIFNDDETKKNFKKLREFLWEKTDLYNALSSDRGRYYYSANPDQVRSLDEKIRELSSKVQDKKPNEKILVDWNTFAGIGRYRFDSIPNLQVTLTADSVKSEINRLTAQKNFIENEIKTAALLDSNIVNVRADLYDVNKQLDSTLAPEYKSQSFRLNITTFFTILIGILLIAFFVVVYKKSDNSLAKEMLSGNGLQFITLFILIISVILFGILSILEGRELAAILSGISGYILGKGTQRELATVVTTAGNVATANAANPNAGMQPVQGATPAPVAPVTPEPPIPGMESTQTGAPAEEEDIENADAPITLNR